jgi:hypothetical protein
MNNEEMDLLKKTAKLAEENSKMLKSMRRSKRVSIAWRIIKWVVILVIVYYIYQWVQPLVAQLQETYSAINEAKDSIVEFKADTDEVKTNIQDLFNFEP